MNTRPTPSVVADDDVELRKEIARAIFGDDRNFDAMPESYHEVSLYKAADRVIEMLASRAASDRDVLVGLLREARRHIRTADGIIEAKIDAALVPLGGVTTLDSPRESSI